MYVSLQLIVIVSYINDIKGFYIKIYKFIYKKNDMYIYICHL